MCVAAGAPSGKGPPAGKGPGGQTPPGKPTAVGIQAQPVSRGPARQAASAAANPLLRGTTDDKLPNPLAGKTLLGQ